MKRHFLNAICGVIDYAAFPAGMLLVAPIMLKHLGAAAYGLWAVATVVTSIGAILSSGFGDAALQMIAAARAAGDVKAIEAAVRGAFSIHAALGAVCCVFTLATAGMAAHRLSAGEPWLFAQSVVAIRLAGGLILVRALEAVCVGTQRAFESYGRAMAVSVAARVASLGLVCDLAWRGRTVALMLLWTLVITVVGLMVQMWALAGRLGARALVPSMRWMDAAMLVEQGRFTWMLAASGVVFSYADRLVLGMAQGAVSVAWYALCVQIAQPVYGLAANGLHFLFPHLARARELVDLRTLRAQVRKAQLFNTAGVGFLAALAIVGGKLALRLLAQQLGGASIGLLIVIVVSFALLGASVTATYALLALRKAQIVGWCMAIAALVMLVSMPALLTWRGAQGLAFARILFGGAALLMYVPLWRTLRIPRDKHGILSVLASESSAGDAL